MPWTDWAGRRHERMIGRPVGMHAMRGISAHSNGFHTCRAIHLLQMLLGSIDAPGGWRYKPPFPQPVPPAPKPARQAGRGGARTAAAGPAAGLSRPGLRTAGRRPTARRSRIDKAFSWEAPLAAHGLMHMVIANACDGDPYPIDTLFLYMANMAWNSAMNAAGTIAMLTDKRSATGDYRIPHIIYADAYFSEMVAYADLVLPDTTYLERWDCISLLDRPICAADGPADAIRQPVVEPDRDVRPFQDVLIDLGARLGLPGMVEEDGAPRYPGGYADYIVHHERKPGIGMLAGWRGADGEPARHAARPTRAQLERYIANGCFWRHEMPRRGALLQACQPGLSRVGGSDGLHRRGRADRRCSSTASRCRSSASPRRAMAPCSRPSAHRARDRDPFRSAADLVPAVRGDARDDAALPAARDHPAADGHVSLLGLAERLAAPDPRQQPAVHATARRREALGLADDDWVWVDRAITAASRRRSG